jgi:peptidoglycan/LPS O-acetylase OafA/YrhL
MVYLGVAIVLICSVARLFAAIAPEIQWDAGIRKVVFLRLDSIMVGVLFCFFMENYKWAPRPNFLIYSLVLCFFVSCAFAASMSGEELSRSFFAKTALFNMASIGCLGVILIGYQQKIGPRMTAAVGFFSKISYSAYLCNMLVISLINYFFGNISPFIKWIAFFPLVIFIAWLSYTFWEKKFMDYRDKNYRESSAA